MKKVNISEAIFTGWKKTRENFWVITNAILFTILVYFIVDLFSSHIFDLNVVISVIGFALGILATNFMTFVLMRFFIDVYDGKPVSILGMFKNKKGFYKFFILYLAINLSVLAGLFLLIIPAIYIVLTYSFAIYVMIDKNLGIQESLVESFRISKGERLNLLKFWLALIVLNFLGAAVFLVGLLLTLPISFLAIVHVYRSLSKMDSVTPIDPYISTHN